MDEFIVEVSLMVESGKKSGKTKYSTVRAFTLLADSLSEDVVLMRWPRRKKGK